MTDTHFPTPPESPSSSRPTRGERAGPAARLPADAFPGYEVLRELGRGGMGVVYLAKNLRLDRLEAIKVLRGAASEERFEQEVRAAARLRHPNVVTVFAALVSGSRLAFAMEYVEGETLSRRVRAGGPLPPPLACEYACQAALGLQHAHVRGITHRDVKPQNLMLCRADGRDVVKVLDFGLVKMGSPPEGDAVTLDGQILGTPGYAAPEQMHDARTADIRADVYGLGVTLYFLLTGEQPSGGRPDLDPNSAARRGWPPGLATVLARMTANDPGERYQSLGEVAGALAPFAAPATPAPRAPSHPRARRWGRRLALAAVVGAVALAVVAAALARRLPPPSAPDPLPQRPAPQFVAIFNGKDLDGWVVDGGPPDQWRVESGAIATTGTRNGPKTWLLSARDYADFRLRFEYQLDPGGNSGFVFRAVPGERPVLRAGAPPLNIPYHQQVELSDDGHKDWWWLPTGQVNGGSGRDAPALKPARPAPFKQAPEWNAVEVEMRKQLLLVSVNGERVQTADLDRLLAMGSSFPALRRSGGRIGFQQFARTARFRNVEILELAGEP